MCTLVLCAYTVCECTEYESDNKETALLGLLLELLHTLLTMKGKAGAGHLSHITDSS